MHKTWVLIPKPTSIQLHLFLLSFLSSENSRGPETALNFNIWFSVRKILFEEFTLTKEILALPKQNDHVGSTGLINLGAVSQYWKTQVK